MKCFNLSVGDQCTTFKFKFMQSGTSVARSNAVQEDLGSICGQDGIFWKLSPPFFLTINCKPYYCNLYHIQCPLSQKKMNETIFDTFILFVFIPSSQQLQQVLNRRPFQALNTFAEHYLL